MGWVREVRVVCILADSIVRCAQSRRGHPLGSLRCRAGLKPASTRSFVLRERGREGGLFSDVSGINADYQTLRLDSTQSGTTDH